MNQLSISLILIDNFSSHKTHKVVEAAKEFGIYLVCLPAYSPDLNPIEFIWKSIRREISNHFINNLDDMKMTISEVWAELSGSLSFAKHWINMFLRDDPYYSNLCS